ncbi:MAG: hypothetical protein NVS2B16_29720 [Chloroflexota bacterium]
MPWCDPNVAQKYGMDVSAACFNTWYAAWGYLAQSVQPTPVILGEFGTENGYRTWQQGDPMIPTTYDPSQFTDWPNNEDNYQGAWFTNLVDYIATYGLHWTYWSLNGTQSQGGHRDPSAPDYYGILRPDWQQSASSSMMSKLLSIM